MLISVIITVYNCEKYLEDAIDSVISQKEVEWELIIVNDGSTDNTKDILNKYQKHSKITIFNVDRVGRGKALNLALSYSSGKYVAVLDADDLFHPNKLITQLNVLQEKEDLGVLATDDKIVGPLYKMVSVKDILISLDNLKLIDVTNRLGNSNPVCHSSVLIRRKALKEVNGYDDNRQRQFDYDLWIRLVDKGWRIGKLNVPLTYKRVHKEQNFEKRNRINYLKSSISLQKKAIRTLKLPKRMYVLCYSRFVYGLLPSRLRMMLRNINKNS